MTLLERKEEAAPFIFLDTDKNTLILRRKGSFVDLTEFRFDAVLPSTARQIDVYNTAARAVVMDVLNGFNGTVMAYGQTGAGKTYTLSAKHPTAHGIIPRSAAEIFEKADADREFEYHVSMSYIQIYMEQIQDLLRPESCNMQIREGDNGVFVSGVKDIKVKSVEDCMRLLMLGDQNRCFAFTKLNAHSSRSHAIVILTVEKKPARTLQRTQGVLVGKLFLVDLAGSERLKKSGSEGLRASEAMSVNLSLTCLGKCISARTDPNKTHVPFRDSKLTRLLQESLGGNAKTALVINIAPCSEYMQESLSSLQFGSRAMKVATRPILNVEEEFKVLTKSLQETLELQDEKLHSLQVSMLAKEDQLLEARKSLAEKAQQLQELQEQQNSTNLKFVEQMRVKEEGWKQRIAAAMCRLNNVKETTEEVHKRVISLSLSLSLSLSALISFIFLHVAIYADHLQAELLRLKEAANRHSHNSRSSPFHVLSNGFAKVHHVFSAGSL
ncbi:unnamed protein product [Sphagnum jensenii]|uniref:Kinesin-like protein n=1 Tax=Sphagnum jensenii TaxID=128206 RepID=A0ABP0WVJ2_9BRYO